MKCYIKIYTRSLKPVGNKNCKENNFVIISVFLPETPNLNHEFKTTRLYLKERTIFWLTLVRIRYCLNPNLTRNESEGQQSIGRPIKLAPITWKKQRNVPDNRFLANKFARSCIAKRDWSNSTLKFAISWSKCSFFSLRGQFLFLCPTCWYSSMVLLLPIFSIEYNCIQLDS